MNRVVCGDALYTLKKFKDGEVGAIISDPPFFTGIGRDDGGFGSDPWENISSIETAAEWATQFMLEFKRTVRKGGAVVVMCGCHASAAWMTAADIAGLVWMAEIDVLWNVGKPRMRNFGGLMTHVLWFARPGARHTWNSNRRAIYSNVLVAKKVPIPHRVHISQKPIEITNFLVSLLTRHNDLVVDPFCGSGSTLVSAALCDRPYLGIDRVKKNVIEARKRLVHPDNEDQGELSLWVNGRMEAI